MKFVRLLGAGLLVVISAMAGMLGTSSPAYADSNTFYSRYDFDVTLRADGWADVTSYLDLDFTAQRGRGPILSFITQMDEPGTDRYRIIEYKNFNVTSPTGASTQVHTQTDSNTITYQIGNENRYYYDVQSYVITYSVFGLVQPNHSSGFDEFNWNIIGESFDLRIVNPSVTLRGPAAVTSQGACFYGSTFSTPCEATTSGSTVTYKAPTLRAGQGMQIGAGYPVGTFVGAEPEYGEHLTLAALFGPSVLNVSVGAVAALVGVASLTAAKRRFGRDDIFAGLTPGNIPAGGDGPTMRGKLDTVAVAFTPPTGVRPGEAAVLLNGGGATAKGTELSATIVDLAVRGYVTIAEEETGGLFGAFKSKDWTIAPTNRPVQGLFPYEVGVLSLLGGRSGGPVSLKALTSTQSSAKQLLDAKTNIAVQAVSTRHWFRSNPTVLRAAWLFLAFGGICLGALAALGGALLGVSYVGIVIVAVSVAALISGMSITNRTAVGSAIDAQLRGFKEYISTAEADQLRWEEGEDIYSAYLPWAIVFNEVEHWTKVFAQLEAMGRYQPNPYWYYSPYGYGLSSGGMSNFSEGLVSMTSSMQSMIASSSSYASSGSSSGMGGGSFSGGGGGFGGGGGGSW
ncbi:MAG: DUF2207 domain-containing protein [Propionibacteriaceae bacterium]|jgi:uncharacterized membrane protein YgcG|nr:DUF2207 domain-containing protein [Propionibacteriaceae bacterium]